MSCVFEPSDGYPVSVLCRLCVQWLSLPQLSHFTASVRINTSSISTCSLILLVHDRLVPVMSSALSVGFCALAFGTLGALVPERPGVPVYDFLNLSLPMAMCGDTTEAMLPELVALPWPVFNLLCYYFVDLHCRYLVTVYRLLKSKI